MALKVCENGHSFEKSSNCNTCPVCEAKQKSIESLFSNLSAPARRAMENEGITSLLQLSNYSEKEILKLHGIGKSSIPKLKELLFNAQLSFNQIKNKDL
jgi:hypothetical protein